MGNLTTFFIERIQDDRRVLYRFESKSLRSLFFKNNLCAFCDKRPGSDITRIRHLVHSHELKVLSLEQVKKFKKGEFLFQKYNKLFIFVFIEFSLFTDIVVATRLSQLQISEYQSDNEDEDDNSQADIEIKLMNMSNDELKMLYLKNPGC